MPVLTALASVPVWTCPLTSLHIPHSFQLKSSVKIQCPMKLQGEVHSKQYLLYRGVLFFKQQEVVYHKLHFWWNYLQPKRVGCYKERLEKKDVFTANTLKAFRVGYFTTPWERMGLVSHMAIIITKNPNYFQLLARTFYASWYPCNLLEN